MSPKPRSMGKIQLFLTEIQVLMVRIQRTTMHRAGEIGILLS